MLLNLALNPIKIKMLTRKKEAVPLPEVMLQMTRVEKMSYFFS
jgi:hypothetical protein